MLEKEVSIATSQGLTLIVVYFRANLAVKVTAAAVGLALRSEKYRTGPLTADWKHLKQLE